MIDVNTGFDVGSAVPIDGRITLTKAQMLTVNEDVMPDVYFCVCKDDGALYTFNKSNTVDVTTGKFRKQVNGSGGCSVDVELDTTINYVAKFTDLS